MLKPKIINEKKSNMQLLRIVIIIMVIILHYNFLDVGGGV